MAATLASVCSVPLTSVLLLFELTKDYRIILPLMVIFLQFRSTLSHGQIDDISYPSVLMGIRSSLAKSDHVQMLSWE